MNFTVSLDERSTERPGLEPLITGYEYGRYCEDRGLPIEQSRRLVLDRLRQSLAAPEIRSISVCSPANELLGLLVFKRSAWDSEHFGYPVAVIESLFVGKAGSGREAEIVDLLLSRFLDWCKVEKIRFSSARVPAMDLAAAHGLERWGFRFIESWIFNKYDLSRLSGSDRPQLALRLARPEDCPSMIEYSRGAFVTHRFHADTRISREKADSLYEKWILTAFSDPNQEILVADAGGRPAAFMIYSPSDLRPYFGQRFAMWKMGLLDPRNRSHGLGTDFFRALLYHHRDQGFDVVDSGLSLRNLTSLNLHIKLNFKTTSVVVTLHRWSD